MHARYAERGLRILGFPCNQFGKQVCGGSGARAPREGEDGPRMLPERPFPCLLQEPGDNADIKAFAENYGVKFDMYSKIDVNGDDAHPLWKWMKDQPKGRGTLGK